MTITNKFILKSLESFNSGKFYQAVREFNSGLLRDIENNSFSSIVESLNTVLPILEAHSLYHESEQIIQYYFTHLKKHKAINDGFMPVITFFNNNFVQNASPKCTLKFFDGFLEFITNNPDQEIINYYKNSYLDLLQNSKQTSLYPDVEGKIFDSLILLQLFQEAESMAYSNYLNDLTNQQNLNYILYSLVVLAINEKISESTKIIRDLRKLIPLDIQKQSPLFQCCTEFLLASSSKDYDWIQELQVHFGEVLKDKLNRLLIMNLIKVVFPEETKVSLFDLFK